MKKFISPAAAVLLTATAVTAQVQTDRVFTHPQIPDAAALDRLNLRLAWQAVVPTADRRDGVFSVQILPDVVLVQTRGGGITALEPATGRQRWHTQVGIPNRVYYALGYNSRSVFGYSGLRLFAVDRRTGALQWMFDPKGAPSARPVADEERLYLATGTGRIYVYELPYKGRPAPVLAADQRAEQMPPPTPKPNFAEARRERLASIGALSTYRAPPPPPNPNIPQEVFNYQVVGRLELPPVIAGELMILADTNGTFFAMAKEARDVRYQRQASAPLVARMGQFDTMVYVASQDYNVYALDTLANQIIWRFAAGAPILRQPVVMDEDVYVASAGLSRVNRQTGTEAWRVPDAEYFLAANRKFVYASDPSGRLLILDRALGTRLTGYDTRDFTATVSNEFTDRLFLVSNDGTVLCLHDRDYPVPLVMKSFRDDMPPPRAKPAGERKRAPAKAPAPKPEPDK